MDDVGSDTTNSFTLRATTGSKTGDRAFGYTATDNPIAGLTSRFNSDNYGGGSFTSQGGLTEITTIASTIASVTGNSNYVHTRLYQTADGSVADWKIA